MSAARRVGGRDGAVGGHYPGGRAEQGFESGVGKTVRAISGRACRLVCAYGGD